MMIGVFEGVVESIRRGKVVARCQCWKVWDVGGQVGQVVEGERGSGVVEGGQQGGVVDGGGG